MFKKTDLPADAAAAYREELEKLGFIQSMSRKGEPHDNAVAENFFSCLKCELVYLRSYATRSQAQNSIFRYMPDNPMYLKNIGKNGKGPSIPCSCNNNMTYMSVPLRSLYFILPTFPLTPEETQAIMYHDGQYVDDNKSVATKECPLLFLLQYADTWSTFVLEKGD